MMLSEAGHAQYTYQGENVAPLQRVDLMNIIIIIIIIIIMLPINEHY
jgi:hypothetical protein